MGGKARERKAAKEIRQMSGLWQDGGKAVWWGVVGCGAPSGRDMGAPAEWLGGGVGYTGKGRVEKEMMFLPGVCRRTAKAAEGAV